MSDLRATLHEPFAMHIHTLRTRDGALVARVYVPPFHPYAEVLMWGERFFVWDQQRKGYFEALCFWIPPALEVPEPGRA